MSDFEELERIAETVGRTDKPMSTKKREHVLKLAQEASRGWKRANSFYSRGGPYEPSLPRLKFMEDPNKT